MAKADKIALILYTVTAWGDTPARAAKALRRIAKIGYRKVQVSGSFRLLDAAELRRMCDDAGLKIIGSHLPWDMFSEDPARVIADTGTWGAKHAAIPMYRPPEGKAPRAGWRAFAKRCNTIGRKLKEAGVTLQYHNHAFEFEKFGIRGGRGGVCPHKLLLDGTDGDLLQPELDLGWVARAGLDPAAYVASLKRPMDQVHVKDWGVMNGQDPVWRAVGEGNLNWPAITRACRAAGVKTYIVEQDACPVTGDPFKSVAISFENLMDLPL